jgi:hypothetical protein
MEIGIIVAICVVIGIALFLALVWPAMKNAGAYNKLAYRR